MYIRTMNRNEHGIFGTNILLAYHSRCKLDQINRLNSSKIFHLVLDDESIELFDHSKSAAGFKTLKYLISEPKIQVMSLELIHCLRVLLLKRNYEIFYYDGRNVTDELFLYIFEIHLFRGIGWLV